MPTSATSANLDHAHGAGEHDRRERRHDGLGRGSCGGFRKLMRRARALRRAAAGVAASIMLRASNCAIVTRPLRHASRRFVRDTAAESS